MNPEQIRDMTLQERIQTMEQLWDSLLDDDRNIPSPEWHGDILEDRKRKMESGEAKYLTIDELKKLKSA